MTCVREVMIKDVVSVSPSDLATKARSIIRKYGYRALPVTEGGRIVGLVSRGDLMKVTSNKTNITVAGLMNRNPTTVCEGEDLFQASKKLLKSENRVLLVEDSGNLRGVVSTVDIVQRFLEEGYRPVKKKVSDVMAYGGDTCSPGDEVSAVMSRLQRNDISGLPVLDGDRVVGVVTTYDLFEKGRSRISKESGKVRKQKIEGYMTYPAQNTSPDADIVDVAEVMVKKRFALMPVTTETGKYVGVLTIEGVMSAYLP